LAQLRTLAVFDKALAFWPKALVVLRKFIYVDINVYEFMLRSAFVSYVSSPLGLWIQLPSAASGTRFLQTARSRAHQVRSGPNTALLVAVAPI
jgi:hypothetical protein